MSSTEARRDAPPARRSLRRAIAIRLGLGTAFAILASGWLIYQRIEHRLLGELDQVLLSRAQAIATFTELEQGEGYELEFSDVLMPEFSRSREPGFYQVWVEGGRVLGRSSSLGTTDLDHDPDVAIAPIFGNRVLPDGRRGRFVELDFAPQNEIEEAVFENRRSPDGPEVPLSERTATIVVATGLADLERTLGVVRNLIVATGSILFLLLLGLSSWAIAAGLAPLVAIGGQVEALRPEVKGARIALPDVPREIDPLLRQLNEMLERNRAAFEREKRLSSDLAHELRTPVAELRNLAEVGQRWPEDTDSTRAFFLDVGAIAVGMEQTLETLLTLARVEAGIERLELRPIAIAPLVETALRRASAEATRRGVRWKLDAPPEAIACADPRLLGLLLQILLDNAVAHTPAGAEFSAHLAVRADRATLTFSNPAPDLRPEDLERIFERFWRADPSRTDRNHSGLGLSLARALANAMAVALVPTLGPDGQFRITIELPTA